MKLFRTIGRAIRFGTVVASASLDGLRRKPQTFDERANWLHYWAKRALRVMNVHVEVHGVPPGRGLLTSNHLSYLDVLVISSVFSSAFVSKDEVEDWPFVGWLTRIAGTIFVDRTQRADTVRVNEAVNERFASGQVVVIFPEGTSTDGSRILPFFPSLMQPAIAAGQPVTPAFLRYESVDGDAATEVCYWGDMTFVPHVLRLLGTKRVNATLAFGEARVYLDRKTAAVQCRDEVVRLAESLSSSQTASYSSTR